MPLKSEENSKHPHFASQWPCLLFHYTTNYKQLFQSPSIKIGLCYRSPVLFASVFSSQSNVFTDLSDDTCKCKKYNSSASMNAKCASLPHVALCPGACEGSTKCTGMLT